MPRTPSFPQQRGSISLWRYTESTRNFSGWHLSANDDGAIALKSILHALQESGGTCTLTVTRPSAAVLSVPNNRGGHAAWSAPNRWRICYQATADEWRFPPTGEPAVLTLGTTHLGQLVAGLDDILAGQGDYSIGIEGEELWFWWQIRDSA